MFSQQPLEQTTLASYCIHSLVIVDMRCGLCFSNRYCDRSNWPPTRVIVGSIKGQVCVFTCCRQKLQPHITDLLQGLPISKDWALAGRPCSPRVLFVFTSATPAGNHGNGGVKHEGSTSPRSEVKIGG